MAKAIDQVQPPFMIKLSAGIVKNFITCRRNIYLKNPPGNITPNNEKLIHTFPLDWSKAKVFLLTTLFHIVLEILANAIESLSFYLPLTCQQNSGGRSLHTRALSPEISESMGSGGGGVGWGLETRVCSVSHCPCKPHKHLFTKHLLVRLHVNCIILAEVPTCPPPSDAMEPSTCPGASYDWGPVRM